MRVTEQAQPFLKIHPDDNVLVALKDLACGTSIAIDSEEILLKQDVAAKHKIFHA
jgi:altronate hydrolase